jgi:hypothetical protein
MMFTKTLGLTLLLVCTTGAFASDLSLEPCINGEVSATGNFPSQAMEDQIHAYLKWRSDHPYYLFAVASALIETPFEEGTTAGEVQ